MSLSLAPLVAGVRSARASAGWAARATHPVVSHTAARDASGHASNSVETGFVHRQRRVVAVHADVPAVLRAKLAPAPVNLADLWVSLLEIDPAKFSANGYVRDKPLGG